GAWCGAPSVRSQRLGQEADRLRPEIHSVREGSTMSGGGGGGGTQVVKNEPPEWLKPFQTEIGQRASQLSQTPLQFYPGQTYAGLSPETEAALQMQTQRALAGSPVTQAMQAELTRTLGGQYLDPTANPAFQKG